MIAFAVNSIVNRLAVGEGKIDPANFTAIRLAAGAMALGVLAWGTAERRRSNPGITTRSIVPALVLFLYAAAFSYAYERIGAAVGALILFASIQLTMVGAGLVHGDRPSRRTWAGLGLSFAGLVALTLPGASRPDVLGFALMLVSGVASGTYSLLGKRAEQPVAANAASFALTLPCAGLMLVQTAESRHVTAEGALLAVLAGAVTSGFAYALWWRALRGLTATEGAVVQLSVPVLAATGGAIVLGEAITLRLFGSGLAVLFGIALAIGACNGRPRPRRTREPLRPSWSRRSPAETWAKR